MCIDYQGLNKITRKGCYPISLVADLLDALKKARLYTKIDLRSVYHFVCITEGEEWKKVFYIYYDLFK